MLEEYSVLFARIYGNGNAHTSPVTCNSGPYFFARMERRVVLPAPDGPIIARVVPGKAKPVTPLRMVRSATEALTLSQVR